jgi:hypothetical protein
MLKLAIVRIVDLCTRHPWWVIALALALSSASVVFVGRHFAIKTDINELISPELPWGQRVKEFVREFPQRKILAVIDASTPEVVEQAATKLRQALEARPDLFFEVRQPQSGSFFRRNGLLYLSVDEVKQSTDRLIRADALIGTLSADRSLRGTLDALSLALVGGRLDHDIPTLGQCTDIVRFFCSISSEYTALSKLKAMHVSARSIAREHTPEIHAYHAAPAWLMRENLNSIGVGVSCLRQSRWVTVSL